MTLTEFARHARARAQHAYAIFNGADEVELNPSEDACRFCKAKATCPALLANVQDAVGADFENLDDITTDEVKLSADAMGENALSIAMAAVGLVEDWCKAVRAKVESDLLAGKRVNGWKLVQGRKGHRRWGDEAAVEKALRKYLGAAGAFDKSLISPATAEKKMKANKGGWERVQALIVQKDGPPSVAPESDKRPAWSPADDFENLETEN